MAQALEAYAPQIRSLNRESDPTGWIGYFDTHAIDGRTALRYQLGYVGEPLPGDEGYRGWLAIPYLAGGKCVMVRFRRPPFVTDGPKFLYKRGSKPRLYNVAAYHDARDTIGITEGEIDAIAATERLGVPSMGVPGATQWSSREEVWTPLLKDFRKVVIFADGDDAGREFASTVADSAGWRGLVAQCPPGEDVSSMVAAGREAELRALYEAA